MIVQTTLPLDLQMIQMLSGRQYQHDSHMVPYRASLMVKAMAAGMISVMAEVNSIISGWRNGHVD